MATVSYNWIQIASDQTNDTITKGNQAAAAIAALQNGSGYFTAWDDAGGSGSVAGRVIEADGTPVDSQFQVNSTAISNQYDSSVATLINGNVVVAFTDTSADAGGDIRARLFTPDGTPVDLDFGISTAAQDDSDCDVAALADGGFVVSWTRDYGGGDKDICLQIFQSNGTPRGSLVLVDSSSVVNTNSSQVIGLTNGNIAVVWEQEPVAGGDTEVRVRLYDSNGTALTSSLLIDTDGSINEDIQIVALQDGGFAVAYVDNGWAAGAGTDITMQIFNANGTARTGALMVNGAGNGGITTGDQNHPTVTVMSNGFIVVAWNNGANLVYQAYDPNGNAIGTNSAVHYGVIEAEIAGLANGMVAAVQSSAYSDGDGNSIRSSIFALTCTTKGDSTDESLTGDGLRDEMHGYEGNDTLSGGGGDDWLDGGFGNDILDGGKGVDRATYDLASSGVTVDLAIAGAQDTGGAGLDILISIEDLAGSMFGDILRGDGKSNSIDGWIGNDIIEGRGGNDTLNGGDGSDWASYESAGSAVKVSLATEAAQNTGGAGIDTLMNFENLIGSKFNDVLTGNGKSNQLKGGAGADMLIGAGGDDILDGGAGNDTLNGGVGSDWASYASASSGVHASLAIAGAQNTVGAGVDTFVSIENLIGSSFKDVLTGNGQSNYLKGGAGADTLNGGSGADILEGGSGDDVLNGGAGFDLGSYASAGSAVKVNLAYSGAQNTGGGGLDKLISIEGLIGTNFHDTFIGDGGSNKFLGGAGNDTIKGGAGDDILIGQDGADRLTGGAGHDTFVFQSVYDSTFTMEDLITDFGPGDRIDLSAIDADDTTAGNQAFHLDGTIGGPGDIGITFDAANNRTVIELYAHNYASSDATIFLSGNHTNLTAADFVL